jgi:hypothetical protein
VEAAVALSAGLIALSTACSSSGGKSSTPTAPPVPTAFPQPTLDADTVNAPLKGFSAKVPSGWYVRTNFATDANARFPTDAFFGPKGEGDVQASIAVTCYAADAGKTLEIYRDEWKQFVTAFSVKDLQVDEAKISGMRAFVFAYTQALHTQSNDPTPVAKDVEVAKQDYILVQDDCRWLIAVLTPPGQLETYKPAIGSFFSTLRFTSRLR